MTTLKATPLSPKAHKHAALIKQWVDDPSQPIWYWDGTVWQPDEVPLSVYKSYAIGDKPTSPPKRMCVLAGVEFPAPETEAPKVGTDYYRPDMVDTEDAYTCYWDGDKYDQHRLEAGLVHLTKEAAMQHAKALLAANKAAVTPKE